MKTSQLSVIKLISRFNVLFIGNYFIDSYSNCDIVDNDMLMNYIVRRPENIL